MSSKSRASAMYGVRRWLQPRNRTSSPDGGLDHDARSCFSRGESHLSRLRQMFGPSLCGIALQNTRGIPLSRYRSWYRSSSRPYGLAPLEQKASQDIQPVQRSSTSPRCSPAASALTIPGASSWSEHHGAPAEAFPAEFAPLARIWMERHGSLVCHRVNRPRAPGLRHSSFSRGSPECFADRSILRIKPGSSSLAVSNSLLRSLRTFPCEDSTACLSPPSDRRGTPGTGRASRISSSCTGSLP